MNYESLGQDWATVAGSIIGLLQTGTKAGIDIYSSYNIAKQALSQAKTQTEYAKAQLEIANLEKRASELLVQIAEGRYSEAEEGESKFAGIGKTLAIGGGAAALALALFSQ